MLQFYIKNNDTINIKVTFFIMEEAFIDLFSKDLKNLFLKEDIILIGYIIKNKNILK